MSLKLVCGLKQKLSLNQKLQQSLNLLSLSYEELLEAAREELLENPFLSGEVKSPPLYEAGWIKSPKSGSSAARMEDFITEPESLKSYALKQAEASVFTKKVKAAVFFLISFLDERGRLCLNIEEAAAKEKISKSLLKKGLQALQSLEPAGIGARSLQECLLIQLKNKKGAAEKAALIVKNHLENLRQKKYTAIAYDLNASIEEVKGLIRLIQSLEPNPGRRFSPEPTVFIQPDLYIYKEKGSYRISLNQRELPELTYSNRYAKTFERLGKITLEEQKYISEKKAQARWFIQALRQRDEKIKQIAAGLIERQKDFFEKGRLYLKPLKMQDLADKIGAHVSTVSRAVNNKYAQTPQGLIALKSFFQKGLETEKGGAVCALKIKTAIQKWIQDESPEEPLSDSRLREKIYKAFNIWILKRSVSYYRASMGIPAFKTRKRGFLNAQAAEL